MDDLTRQLRATYRLVASNYAQVNAVMPPSVETAAVAFAGMLTGKRILDLGCGCGRDLAWFKHTEHQAIGIDLSLDMLRQARTLDLNSLTQANMQCVPLKSQALDGVWANASLLHIPKDIVGIVLQECHRILRIGGLLFVAMQAGEEEVWEDSSYGQQAPRFFARYQPGEFRLLLEQAGFSIHHFDEQKSNPKRHWMHYYAFRSN